ncbi:hypothetical protein K438DRAFT_1790301 [Mycena galopus ATCC 62051]|nr:hypothetical protein K438DRAFT_1790301 [Mycena galopus ATCC 62051]
MFKNPKSYLQYLMTVLYEHVPEKHHDLISDFLQFQDNDRQTLLYHPGQDTSLPPSSYPPIFYGGLKKDAKMLMLNKVGSMDFQEKGKASKILFQTYFHSVGVCKIKQFWTKIAFASIITANALEDEGLKSDGDTELDAEFAAAMEAMSMDVDDANGDISESDEFATQGLVAIRLPAHVPTGPVQANTGLVNNEAQQNMLPGDVLENAGALPVVTARGGGRGQGLRGHARVSRCGAPTGPVDIAVRGGSSRSRAHGGRSVILSDEE